MLVLILVNIAWILYSGLEGFREGFYWHFKSNSLSDYGFEIHPVFALQRGIVLLLSGYLLYSVIGWASIISILSMMLIFSFFHNGVYYKTRNKINKEIYPLGWRDQSTTSTAKMTSIMTWRNRTLFMILGVLFQVFMFYFL